MRRQSPDDGVIVLGSLQLRPVSNFCRAMGVSQNAASRLFRILRVPMLHVKTERYFLSSTLEEAMFAVLEYGGPGLMAPGSLPRDKKKQHAPRELPKDFINDKKRAAAAKRLDKIRKNSGGRAREALMALLKGDPLGMASAVPTKQDDMKTEPKNGRG